MKVVYFQRKPFPSQCSLERLFEDIRFALPQDVQSVVSRNCCFSTGVWRRLVDMVRGAFAQGDINHITGDIHYLTCFLKRDKTILTIHDCVTLERLKGIRFRLFWFFWYWLPSKRCAVITVISCSTRDELLKYLHDDKLQVEVIPCCVSPEFKPFYKEFNSDCPQILQIGTSRNKNLERVAAALSGFTCKLIIVGKLIPEQIKVLQKYTISYENHVGISRQAVLEQYKSADLVMFASLYEGFGLPIIEANAVGRPVITSQLYSMPEVGGDAACYVNPKNIQEIRKAVERICSDMDYRQQLIENGYQNVRRFQPETVAAQYAKLYRKIYKQNK